MQTLQQGIRRRCCQYFFMAWIASCHICLSSTKNAMTITILAMILNDSSPQTRKEKLSSKQKSIALAQRRVHSDLQGECSPNCFSCTPYNGSCKGGCKPGYHGSDCEQVCPKGYYGKNCSTLCTGCSSCNHVNGQCLNECDPGHFGELCQTKCPDECAGNLCNAVTGLCYTCPPGKSGSYCDEDCQDGFYGSNCSKVCHRLCKNGCYPATGSCKHKQCPPGRTGKSCKDYCIKGLYGLNCIEKCSVNCRKRLCHPEDGHCISCVPGKTGSFCDEDLSTECDSGFYGTACSQPCPDNCVNHECDAASGYCSSCPPGKRGVKCEEECHTNCHTCSIQTHDCFTCRDGWKGKFCTKVCEIGRYGPNCSETCSDNCTAGQCDRVTGHCIDCPIGTFGDMCQLAEQTPRPIDRDNHLIPQLLLCLVALSILASIFFIITEKTKITQSNYRHVRLRIDSTEGECGKQPTSTLTNTRSSDSSSSKEINSRESS